MMAEDRSNRFERLVGRRLPFPRPPRPILLYIVLRTQCYNVSSWVSRVGVISLNHQPLRVSSWRLLVCHMN